MGLFHVLVRKPGGVSLTVDLGRVPWVIGRSAGAGLVLEGQGVWDRHLVLDLSTKEGLIATVQTGALATVDGMPFTRHRIRNADEIRVGEVVLAFFLKPPVRRRAVIWEVSFWIGLAVVLAGQAALGWWLVG